jgi:hypothetical protein
MKLRRLFPCVLVIVALFLVACSGGGLSEEDLTTLEYVSKSFQDTSSLTALHMVGGQTVNQDISAQGTTIKQTIEQNFDGDLVLATDSTQSDATQMTLEQSLSASGAGQNVSGTMTMDMIITDGVVYVQVYDTTGSFSGQFPDGWVNVSENPSAIPGMNLLNIEQLAEMIRPVTYALNKDTVNSISEQSRETVDGQEMRVFSLSLNSKGLSESSTFKQLASAFNTGSLGVDAQQIINDMLKGASLDLRLWIGTEDNLMHKSSVTVKIDANLNISGENVNLKQTSEGAFTFSNFNQPVEIQAPEVAG